MQMRWWSGLQDFPWGEILVPRLGCVQPFSSLPWLYNSVWIYVFKCLFIQTTGNAFPTLSSRRDESTRSCDVTSMRQGRQMKCCLHARTYSLSSSFCDCARRWRSDRSWMTIRSLDQPLQHWTRGPFVGTSVVIGSNSYHHFFFCFEWLVK